MSRAASRRRFRHVFSRIVYSHAFRFVPGVKPIREPQRLDEGVLDQILGVGRVPGQPQRGRVQRLQKLQGPSRDSIRRVSALTAAKHGPFP